MAEGNQPPTLEELQAQLLALQEKQTAQEATIDKLSSDNEKLSSDLAKARELNTRLFLKIPTDDNKEGEEPPVEEDSFDKLLDEVLDKYVIQKKKQTT